MAHCQNCGCSKISCGCKDTYLTTPPPCPTPVDCPEQQPCSEVFDAQCIVYAGEDLLCNQTTIVSQNSSVSAALESIVNYFCTATSSVVMENAIGCAEEPIIAPAGTPVNTALEDVVDYFCSRFETLDFCANTPVPGIQLTDNVVICRNGSTETVNWANVVSTLPIPSVYGLYAQTANSVPVVDINSGTLIGSGVGTLTVPANGFSVGDSFRVRMGGHITCSNTQALTITVLANASTIAQIPFPGIDLKTATNKHWTFDVDFTIRTLGVTGSVASLGQFSYIPNPAGQAFEGSDFSIVSTLNTTVSNTLDIIIAWTSDEGGTNSIYSEYFTLTKTY